MYQIMLPQCRFNARSWLEGRLSPSFVIIVYCMWIYFGPTLVWSNNNFKVWFLSCGVYLLFENCPKIRGWCTWDWRFWGMFLLSFIFFSDFDAMALNSSMPSQFLTIICHISNNIVIHTLILFLSRINMNSMNEDQQVFQCCVHYQFSGYRLKLVVHFTQ